MLVLKCFVGERRRENEKEENNVGKKGGGYGKKGVKVTASLDFHRARISSPGKDVKSVDGES